MICVRCHNSFVVVRRIASAAVQSPSAVRSRDHSSDHLSGHLTLCTETDRLVLTVPLSSTSRVGKPGEARY
jgi:hypothetical protein